MRYQDEVLWGDAPGPGPAIRQAVVEVTEEANRPIPGLGSFFKLLIFSLVILYPIMVVWYFVSPRTYHAFMYGDRAISRPLDPTTSPTNSRHLNTHARRTKHSQHRPTEKASYLPAGTYHS